MIIALFGNSQTGKTTIAKRLAEELAFPLRSCGEAVKHRAQEKGISWDELSDAEHRAVDENTRIWVLTNRPCLVEGRYLHFVLASLSTQVTLVRLEATSDDRRIRQVGLSNAPVAPSDFERADADDLALQERLYNMTLGVEPSLRLNTSQLPVEACVECLKVMVENIRKPHA